MSTTPDEQWDERIEKHSEISTAKIFTTALATHARVESLRPRIEELLLDMASHEREYRGAVNWVWLHKIVKDAQAVLRELIQ